MWNRNVRIVWVSIQLAEPKKFHLNLPISFYAFEELLDCVINLMDFACFFTRRDGAISASAPTIYGIRELLKGSRRLFEALTDTEPYDLVNVETKDVRVIVRIL